MNFIHYVWCNQYMLWSSSQSIFDKKRKILAYLRNNVTGRDKKIAKNRSGILGKKNNDLCMISDADCGHSTFRLHPLMRRCILQPIQNYKNSALSNRFTPSLMTWSYRKKEKHFLCREKQLWFKERRIFSVVWSKAQARTN